ncbi:MAG: P-type conjugative transfer protein TrbG [Erythrobacter sp. RIFCSPHIGHO2_12_FULL_63_10]|nr:MAG: P-type conjugative transfer protein TrbG [Erythrobacter sp. RIFCSPHIGHO2_12_FULL_63_10]
MSHLYVPLRAALAGLLHASSLSLSVPALAVPTSHTGSDRIGLGAPAVWRAASANLSPEQSDALPRRQTSHAARRSPASDPERQVGAANDAARIEPGVAGFDNAIQRYAFTEGALFQVYAKPGQVTDIALQEGEKLAGPGPVAAGDTARWMIGDTQSGSGATSRVHILVKPTRPDISTNLVINTDRRTYHLELRANPRVYMASVSWTYPEDELFALRLAEEEAKRSAPITDGLTLESLNFDYRISGDKPVWRPLRVFDDGRRTLVEFSPKIARSEMPPIFVIGQGGEAQLVNYRVSGRHMILDRLFEKAELRLGKGRKQLRVTITNRARSRS